MIASVASTVQADAHVLRLAALLAWPLLPVLACRGLLRRHLDSRLRLAEVRSAVDYLAFQTRCALAYGPYRWSVSACAYSALLAGTCAAGAYASGTVQLARGGLGWHVQYLDVTDVFAVVLPSAMAALIASLVAVVAGMRYGAALNGTGLFAVVWAIAGALGLLISAAMYRSSGSYLLLLGSALALAATIWLLVPRHGGSTFLRAQHASTLAQQQFSAAARHELPRHGEYEAPRTRGLWRRLQAALFVPSTVPHRVRWDQDGIEVEWLSGAPTRWHWSELVECAPAANGVAVRTKNGQTLEFYQEGRHYRELLSALRIHLWSRERQEDHEGSPEG